MSEQFINLADSDFWWILFAALIGVSPLNTVRYKTLAWAFINCCFIFFILNWHGLIVMAAVVAAYFMLQAIAGTYRIISTFFSAGCIFTLFLLHKSNLLAGVPEFSASKTILSVIGFSYIALRLVEVVRAVYEERHSAPGLVATINYLIPFHMLAAGPIQSYDDYVAQPVLTQAPNMATLLEGIERITLGLFKKFVLAYFISETFLTGFQSAGVYFFIEVQLFFLWLYIDFSAYSDIAVGVGRLLGVPTPENFNHPYLARNAIDFWERWHITLSQFIRRNIFIPLQLFLNRRNNGTKPLVSAAIAFFIAFLLCGLWHGLSVNFLLWGFIHACGLVVANLYRNFLKRKLGSAGVKAYLANKKIRYCMRFVTYEFVAFSLLALFFP